MLSYVFVKNNNHKSDSGSYDFTIVILPDTQYYSASYPDIFTKQTKWIVKNKKKLDISLVLHEGDVVHNRDKEIEFRRARKSLSVLDGVVPYILSIGNNDYDPDSRDSSMFNKYFPPEKFDKIFDMGLFENGKTENAYYLLSESGLKFIVIVIEANPRDETLKWANKIVYKYFNLPVIVLTHEYLGEGKLTVRKTENPNINQNKTIKLNSGEDIWNKFVKHHKNIKVVFSAHVLTYNRIVQEGINGNKVHAIEFNYQSRFTYQSGMLRIINFDGINKKMTVKTYSPSLDVFSSDPKNDFVIEDFDFSLGSMDTISSSNKPPIVNAGVAFIIRVNDVAFLDGFVIADDDNSIRQKKRIYTSTSFIPLC